jgi:hypothetical protein
VRETPPMFWGIFVRLFAAIGIFVPIGHPHPVVTTPGQLGGSPPVDWIVPS